MRITWITRRHPPARGGMAQSSGRIVNSLKDRGHDVNIILLPRPADGANHAEDASEIFWSRQREMAGSVIVGFGGEDEGYLATLWAKWLNSKSVVMLRGNDFEKNIHDSRKGWMAHYILGEADVILAVSGEMAERARVLRKGRPSIHTPNGIDLDEWTYLESDRINAEKWKKTNTSDDRPVIGLFGQLKRKKGLDFAVSLFSTQGLDRRAVLMTVGDIPEDMAERLRTDCAHFWRGEPYQAREALPAYYQIADVVFIPSFYDGTPNVLLEAMALGKVVVGSRVGGMPDLITDGQNGYLFEPGDRRGAIAALEKAMNGDGSRIGENARKTIAEKFTSTHEADIIEAAFRAVSEG